MGSNGNNNNIKGDNIGRDAEARFLKNSIIGFFDKDNDNNGSDSFSLGQKNVIHIDGKFGSGKSCLS